MPPLWCPTLFCLLLFVSASWSNSVTLQTSWQPAQAGRTWLDIGAVWNGSAALLPPDGGDTLWLALNNSAGNVSAARVQLSFGGAPMLLALPGQPLLLGLTTASNGDCTLLLGPLPDGSVAVPVQLAAAAEALSLVVSTLKYQLAVAATLDYALASAPDDWQPGQAAGVSLTLQRGVLYPSAAPQNAVVPAGTASPLRLLVANLGIGSLFNVSASLQLDAQLGLAALSDVRVDALAPGASFAVDAVLAPDGCGTFAGAVDFTTTAGDPVRRLFFVTAEPQPPALLTLTAAAAAAAASCQLPAAADATTTCSLLLANAGLGPAHDVTLQLDLPAVVELLAPAPNASAGRVAYFALPPLAAGASARFDFTLRRSADAPLCQLAGLSLAAAVSYQDACNAPSSTSALAVVAVAVSLPYATLELALPATVQLLDTGALTVAVALTVADPAALLDAPGLRLELACSTPTLSGPLPPVAASVQSALLAANASAATALVNGTAALRYALNLTDACLLTSLDALIACTVTATASYDAGRCPLALNASAVSYPVSLGAAGAVASSLALVDAQPYYETGPPDNGDGLRDAAAEGAFVHLSARFVVPANGGSVAVSLTDAVYTDNFAARADSRLVLAAAPTLQLSYDGCLLGCLPAPVPAAAIDASVGAFSFRLGAAAASPSLSCSSCTAYTIVVDYQLTVDDSSLPDAAQASLRHVATLRGLQLTSTAGSPPAGCVQSQPSATAVVQLQSLVVDYTVRRAYVAPALRLPPVTPCQDYVVAADVLSLDAPRPRSVSVQLTGIADSQLALSTAPCLHANSSAGVDLLPSPLPVLCTGAAYTFRPSTAPSSAPVQLQVAYHSLQTAALALPRRTASVQLAPVVLQPAATLRMSPDKFAVLSDVLTWRLFVYNSADSALVGLLAMATPAGFALLSSSLPCLGVAANTLECPLLLAAGAALTVDLSWRVGPASRCAIGANDNSAALYLACDGGRTLLARAASSFVFPAPLLQADALNLVADLCAPATLLVRLINNGQPDLFDVRIAISAAGLRLGGTLRYGSAESALSLSAGVFTADADGGLTLSAANWPLLGRLDAGQVLFLSLPYATVDAASFALSVNTTARSACGSAVSYASPQRLTVNRPLVDCLLSANNTRKPATLLGALLNLAGTDQMRYRLTCRNAGTVPVTNLVVQFDLGVTFLLGLEPLVVSPLGSFVYALNLAVPVALRLDVGASVSVDVLEQPLSLLSCPAVGSVSATVSHGCAPAQLGVAGYYTLPPPPPLQLIFDGDRALIDVQLVSLANGAAQLSIVVTGPTSGVVSLARLAVDLPAPWIIDVLAPVTVSASLCLPVLDQLSPLLSPLLSFPSTCLLDPDVLASLTVSVGLVSNVNVLTPGPPLPLPAAAAAAAANVTLFWLRPCSPLALLQSVAQVNIDVYARLQLAVSPSRLCIDERLKSNASIAVVWTLTNVGVAQPLSDFDFFYWPASLGAGVRLSAPLAVGASGACNTSACRFGGTLAVGASVTVTAQLTVDWSAAALHASTSLTLRAAARAYVYSPASSLAVGVHSFLDAQPLLLGTLPAVAELSSSLAVTPPLRLAAGESAVLRASFYLYGQPLSIAPSLRARLDLDARLDLLAQADVAGSTLLPLALLDAGAGALVAEHLTLGTPLSDQLVQLTAAVRLNATRVAAAPVGATLALRWSLSLTVANSSLFACPQTVVNVELVRPLLSVASTAATAAAAVFQPAVQLAVGERYLVRQLVANDCAATSPAFNVSVLLDALFADVLLLDPLTDGLDNDGDGVVDEPDEGAGYPAVTAADNAALAALAPCTNVTLLFAYSAAPTMTTGSRLNYSAAVVGHSLPLPDAAAAAAAAYNASSRATVTFTPTLLVDAALVDSSEPGTLAADAVVGEQFVVALAVLFAPGVTRQFSATVSVPAGLALLDAPALTVGTALAVANLTVSPPGAALGPATVTVSADAVSAPLASNSSSIALRAVVQVRNDASYAAGAVYNLSAAMATLLQRDSRPLPLRLQEPTRAAAACLLTGQQLTAAAAHPLRAALNSSETLLLAYVDAVVYSAPTAAMQYFRYVPGSAAALLSTSGSPVSVAEPTRTTAGADTLLTFALPATVAAVSPGAALTFDWRLLADDALPFGLALTGAARFAWRATVSQLAGYPLAAADSRAYSAASACSCRAVATLAPASYALAARTEQNPSAQLDAAVVVGEQLLWQTVLTLDNVAYPLLTVNLSIGAGLAVVAPPTLAAASNVQSVGAVVAPPTPVYGPAVVSVALANVLVNSTSTPRQLRLDWLAQVTNSAAAGAVLRALATVQADNGAAAAVLPSNTSLLTVVEPALAVAAFVAAPVNASLVQRGDRVDYTLRFAASAAAVAYRPVVAGNFSAQLQYVAASTAVVVCTPAGGCAPALGDVEPTAADGTLLWAKAPAQLPAGGNVTLTFSMRVADTAVAGSSLGAVATLQWASEAGTLPGGPALASSGVLSARQYSTSAAANAVAVPVVALSAAWQLSASADAETANPLAGVGEQVRVDWRLNLANVAVPASGVTLSFTVPSGARYLPLTQLQLGGDVLSVGVYTRSAAANGPSTASVTLGQIDVAANSSAAQRYVAGSFMLQVRNTAGVANWTLLTSTASCPSCLAPFAPAAALAVRVVERAAPVLAAATFSAAAELTGGQLVEVQLRIDNADAALTLHQLRLVVATTPAGALVYVPGSTLVATADGALNVSLAEPVAAANTLTFTRLAAAPLQSLVYRFALRLTSAAVFNSSLLVNASYDWASLAQTQSLSVASPDAAVALGALNTANGPRQYSAATAAAALRTRTRFVNATLAYGAHSSPLTNQSAGDRTAALVGEQLQCEAVVYLPNLYVPAVDVGLLLPPGVQLVGVLQLSQGASVAAVAAASGNVTTLTASWLALGQQPAPVQLDFDAASFVRVRFVVQTLNLPGVVVGAQLALAATTGGGVAFAPDRLLVDVVEPTRVGLSVAVVGRPGPYQGGDVAPLTIVVDNAEPALTAVAVAVTLTLRNADFASSSLAAHSNGTTTTWQAGDLAAGGRLAIAVNVTVRNSVVAWSTEERLAVAASYLSIDALSGIAAPLAAAGSTLGPRIYTLASDTSLDVQLLPAVALSVVATSDPSSAPSDRLVVGEQAAVAVTFTFPDAQFTASRYDGAFTLPAGLALLAAPARLAGAGVAAYNFSYSTAPASLPTFAAAAVLVNYSLAAVSVPPPPNNTQRWLRIDWPLQLENVDVADGATLTVQSSSSAVSGPPAASVPVVPDALTFTVVEPLAVHVQLTANASNLTGGDAVRLTLVVSNRHASLAVHQLRVAVAWPPADMAFAAGSASLPPLSASPSALVWSLAAAVAAGQNVTLSFDCQLLATARLGAPVVVNTSADWDSIDAAAQLNAAAVPPLTASGSVHGPRRYAVAASRADVLAAAAAFTSTLQFDYARSSEPASGVDRAAGVVDVVVGEQVELLLTVSLPPLSLPGSVSLSLDWPAAALSLLRATTSAGSNVASYQPSGGYTFAAIVQNASAAGQSWLRVAVVFQLLNNRALVAGDYAANVTVSEVLYTDNASSVVIAAAVPGWRLRLVEPASYRLTTTHSGPAAVEGSDLVRVSVALRSDAPLTDSPAFSPVVAVALPPQLRFANGTTVDVNGQRVSAPLLVTTAANGGGQLLRLVDNATLPAVLPSGDGLLLSFDVLVSTSTEAGSAPRWQASATWASLSAGAALLTAAADNNNNNNNNTDDDALAGRRLYTTPSNASDAVTARADVAAAVWQLTAHAQAVAVDVAPTPATIGAQLMFTLRVELARLWYRAGVTLLVDYDARLHCLANSSALTARGADIDPAHAGALQLDQPAPGVLRLLVADAGVVDGAPASTAQRYLLAAVPFQLPNDAAGLVAGVLLQPVTLVNVSDTPPSALANPPSQRLQVAEPLPVVATLSADDARLTPGGLTNLTADVLLNQLDGPVQLNQLVVVVDLPVDALAYEPGSSRQNGVAHPDPAMLNGGSRLVWNASLFQPAAGQRLRLTFSLRGAPVIAAGSVHACALAASWASMEQSTQLAGLPPLQPLGAPLGPRAYSTRAEQLLLLYAPTSPDDYDVTFALAASSDALAPRPLATLSVGTQLTVLLDAVVSVYAANVTAVVSLPPELLVVSNVSVLVGGAVQCGGVVVTSAQAPAVVVQLANVLGTGGAVSPQRAVRLQFDVQLRNAASAVSGAVLNLTAAVSTQAAAVAVLPAPLLALRVVEPTPGRLTVALTPVDSSDGTVQGGDTVSALVTLRYAAADYTPMWDAQLTCRLPAEWTPLPGASNRTDADGSVSTPPIVDDGGGVLVWNASAAPLRLEQPQLTVAFALRTSAAARFGEQLRLDCTASWLSIGAAARLPAAAATAAAGADAGPRLYTAAADASLPVSSLFAPTLQLTDALMRNGTELLVAEQVAFTLRVHLPAVFVPGPLVARLRLASSGAVFALVAGPTLSTSNADTALASSLTVRADDSGVEISLRADNASMLGTAADAGQRWLGFVAVAQLLNAPSLHAPAAFQALARAGLTDDDSALADVATVSWQLVEPLPATLACAAAPSRSGLAAGDSVVQTVSAANLSPSPLLAASYESDVVVTLRPGSAVAYQPGSCTLGVEPLVSRSDDDALLLSWLQLAPPLPATFDYGLTVLPSAVADVPLRSAVNWSWSSLPGDSNTSLAGAPPLAAAGTLYGERLYAAAPADCDGDLVPGLAPGSYGVELALVASSVPATSPHDVLVVGEQAELHVLVTLPLLTYRQPLTVAVSLAAGLRVVGAPALIARSAAVQAVGSVASALTDNNTSLLFTVDDVLAADHAAGNVTLLFAALLQLSNDDGTSVRAGRPLAVAAQLRLLADAVADAALNVSVVEPQPLSAALSCRVAAPLQGGDQLDCLLNVTNAGTSPAFDAALLLVVDASALNVSVPPALPAADLPASAAPLLLPFTLRVLNSAPLAALLALNVSVQFASAPASAVPFVPLDAAADVRRYAATASLTLATESRIDLALTLRQHSEPSTPLRRAAVEADAVPAEQFRLRALLALPALAVDSLDLVVELPAGLGLLAASVAADSPLVVAGYNVSLAPSATTLAPVNVTARLTDVRTLGTADQRSERYLAVDVLLQLADLPSVDAIDADAPPLRVRATAAARQGTLPTSPPSAVAALQPVEPLLLLAAAASPLSGPSSSVSVVVDVTPLSSPVAYDVQLLLRLADDSDVQLSYVAGSCAVAPELLAGALRWTFAALASPLRLEFALLAAADATAPSLAAAAPDLQLVWYSTNASAALQPYDASLAVSALQRRRYAVHRPVTVATATAPVARDDLFTTFVNCAAELDVLANDGATPYQASAAAQRPDGATLALVWGPTVGTAQLTGNGTLAYAPPLNFVGSATLTYSVSGSLARVTVVVLPNLYAPVAADDVALTCSGCPVVVDALANDSDADGNLDAATLTLERPPVFGSASLRGDQQRPVFVYTSQREFSGRDAFTYRVCDTAGRCDFATVELHCHGAVQPPRAADDAARAWRHGPAVLVDVLANDDAPAADSLLLAVVQQPGHGVAAVSSNAVSYTPDCCFVGVDSFRYRICDAAGACSSAAVVVTVDDNQPPALTDDAAVVLAAPGASVEIRALANDVDIDDGLDAASLRAPYDLAPLHGQVSVDAASSLLVYTVLDALAAADDDTFTYQLCDLAGQCASAAVSVRLAANGRPVAVDDSYAVEAGRVALLQLTANDYDGDGNARYASVSVVGAPPAHGRLLGIDGDSGAVAYLPLRADVADTFRYRLCDAEGLCAAATVRVRVGPNPPPLAADDHPPSAPVGAAQLLFPLLNDVDDNGDLAPRSFAVLTPPAHGTVSYDAAAASLLYTPAPLYVGADALLYRVCDAARQCSNATVHLRVRPPRPARLADDVYVLEPPLAAVLDVLRNDANNVDAATLGLAQPARLGAVFVRDGRLIYTPPPQSAGDLDRFTYTACSRDGLCDSADVVVQLRAAARLAPVCYDDVVRVAANTAASFDPSANDVFAPPAVGRVWLQVVEPPRHAVADFDPLSRRVTVTPQRDFVGTLSFRYALYVDVIDASGELATATSRALDTATVTVVVAPPVEPRCLDDVLRTTTGRCQSANVLANDFDPDAVLLPATLAASTAVADASLSVTAAAGELVFCPPPALVQGTGTIDYWLLDAAGRRHDGRVTFVVTPNQPPLPADDSAAVPFAAVVDVDVLANDVDPDGTPLDPASLSVVAQPAVGLCTPVGATGRLRFTSTAVDFGTAECRYQICDEQAACAQATLSLHCAPNTPPHAEPDVARLPPRAQRLLVAVLDNDYDTDAGDALTTVRIAVPPRHGSADYDPDARAVVYTPAALSSFESDRFAYTVFDRLGANATADVLILPAAAAAAAAAATLPPLAAAAGRAPVALADDLLPVFESSWSLVDVALNDYDVDGDLDRASVTLVQPPRLGVAVVAAGGRLLYTPGPGSAGSVDALVYRVCDATARCATATATLAISARPAPQPVDDQYTLAAVPGALQLLSVLANDHAAATAATLIELTALPALGTASVSAAGVMYRLADWLDASKEAIDRLSYRLCYGADQCSASATVTIELDPNTAPVAVDDALTVTAGGAVFVDVLANDYDRQGNLAPATLRLVAPPASGVVSPSGGGFVYRAASTAATTDTFSYAVSDSAGQQAVAVVSVTVLAAPPAAPVARDDSAGAVVGYATVVDVTANDEAPPGGRLELGSLATLGARSAAGGQLSVRPGSGGGVVYLPPPAAGSDWFAYRVCTTAGVCASATVNVTVAAVNTAPVAVADFFTVPSSSLSTSRTWLPVVANDADVDNNLDAGSLTVLFGPLYGRVTAVDGGRLGYAPDAAVRTLGLLDRLVYRVCDTAGACATATAYVQQLAAALQPPALQPDYAATAVNTPVAVDVLANDRAAVGGGPIDRASLRVVEASAHGGSAVVTDDARVLFTPLPAWTGTAASFDYTVCDSDDLCARAHVVVVVADRWPVLAADDLFIVDADNGTASASVVANDNTAGGLASVALLDGPAHAANFALQLDGRFTYTPLPGFVGSDAFVYQLCSSSTPHCTSAAVLLAVVAAPSSRPPLARHDRVLVADAAAPVLVDVLANDQADAAAVIVAATLATPPSHGTASWDAAARRFRYTAALPLSAASDAFTYRIVDSAGQAATATVSLLFAPWPLPPLLANNLVVAVPPRTPVAVYPLQPRTDLLPDNVQLSVVSAQPPLTTGRLVVDNSTAALQFIPADNFAGQLGVEYRICSPSPTCTTATITFTSIKCP